MANKRDISLATFNLYNRQLPQKHVYISKVKKEDYDAKIAFSSRILKESMPDIVGFQELWSRECLEELFASARLKSAYRRYYIGSSWGGIAVAAAVRRPWKVIDHKVHKSFPDGFKLLKRQRSKQDDPDRLDDEIEVSADRFTRSILQLTVAHESANIGPVEVFCVHLKAKLPTALDREDKNDPDLRPHADALGAAISTIKRTAEAAALRALLNNVMRENNRPVVVLGDFNDGLLSNTLAIISAQPPYKLFQARRQSRSKKNIDMRDRGLYSASMLQQYHSLKDVYYTHNYQGVVETLDHVLVSEQFYDHSPERLWSFKSMRVWNDHVDEHDPREGHIDKTVSDHGVVKAEFVYDKAK